MLSSNLKKYWKKTRHNLHLPGFENDNVISSRLHYASARETAVMMGTALLIGLGCGVLAVGLNKSVHFLQTWIQGMPIGIWNIAFPAIGAGAAIFLIRFLLKDKGGHGVPEVIKSVSLGKGHLPSRTIGSRFIGSILTVGSGGSAGLEGPIVCIGAAWASLVGRQLKFNERRQKLLIAYGTAGAVAGIFNAPITGVFFALEIVLGEWSFLTILPTIIAATTATEFSRLILGNKIQFYQALEQFSLTSLWACLFLGGLMGLASVAFNKSLTLWNRLFRKISKKGWIRATIGGASVGLLGFFMPAILSEGYITTQSFLTDPVRPTLIFVLLFFFLKFIACGLSVGSGGVGGVFAPSLVIGSSIGLAFGMILHQLPFDNLAPPEAFSLAGMAGMVTGVMHSPLTGIFLIMEITGGYTLIIPLMITACSAMLVSHLLDVGSVYTQELIAKGHLVRPGTDAYLLHHLEIQDMLDTDCIPISENMLLGEFIEVFKSSHRNYFPVLNSEDEQCLGVVFLDDIRTYLFNKDLYDLVTMGSVMQYLPQIYSYQSVETALQIFEESNAWSLPVVKGKKFLGMLSKSTLFDNYRREFQVLTEKLE